MIKTVIIAIVIINTPFQPGDFSTGSTTEMYSFLTIFKVSVKCYRLPILMIASKAHKLRTMLINGFRLITNYMYKELLIWIKD